MIIVIKMLVIDEVFQKQRDTVFLEGDLLDLKYVKSDQNSKKFDFCKL